ncbi:MAG: hypothetical protein RIQ33_530 [Bacteroidota bacterium]|jgi:hypothetical protein
MKKIIVLLIITLAPCIFSLSFGEGWGEAAFAQIPTAAGNWQWARSMGSTVTPVAGGVEKTNCMKTDNKGNTYTCGYMYYNPYVQGLHGGKAITQLTMNHSNMNNNVGFIAKHDCSGNLIWINLLFDTLSGGMIKDFAIDTSGNVYFATDLNGWGRANIYWNDSLINIPSTPATTSGASVLFKINSSGSLVWRWSILDVYGSSSPLQFAVAAMVQYQVYEPSFMFVKKDTLYSLGTVDTFNFSYGFISVLKFNINSGTLIERNRIIKAQSGSGIQIKGFGMNQQGNFLAALNIQQDTLKILDTMLIIPQNIGFAKAIIFEFNKTHFIKHLQLGDSAFFYYVDFPNNSDSFNVTATGITGSRLNNKYVFNTKTSMGIYSITSSLVHFDKDFDFKWATNPDTATNGAGFAAITSDVNKNIYGIFNQADGYVHFQKYNSNLNYQESTIMKFKPYDTTIVSKLDVLNTSQPKINGHTVSLVYPSVHENGNISASGEFTSNSIITQNDTAPSFNGNNDLFVTQYGYPCGSNNALIEPVAAELLMATCQNNDSVELNWQDKSNIEFGYHIYRATTLNGAYTLIKTLPKNSTQYTDNTLAINTNYYYKVAAFNNIGDGAFSLDSSKNCKTVGIENSYLKYNQLKIYPNPTQTGQFTIDVNDVNNSNAQLQISNYIGQILIEKQIQLHQNSNQFKIDLSNYSSGTYLVTVKTSIGMYNQKVMVVR